MNEANRKINEGNSKNNLEMQPDSERRCGVQQEDKRKQYELNKQQQVGTKENRESLQLLVKNCSLGGLNAWTARSWGPVHPS